MSEKKFLTAQQIREQKTLVWEDLEVPEWEADGARWVRVKALSAREMDEFEISMMTVGRDGKPVDNRRNSRARLVQLAVINEDGTPLFAKNDIKVLTELPASGLQRVFNKVTEMGRLSKTDMEELTEGFDDSPDGPSPSD